MKNKNIAVFSVMTLTAATVFFFTQSHTEKTDDINFVSKQGNTISTVTEKIAFKDKSEASQATNSVSKKTSTQESTSKTFLTVDARIEKMSEWMDTSEFSREELIAAIDSPILFDLQQTAEPEKLPLDEVEKSDGRSFFQSNQARVAVLMPGDNLSVPVPDSEDIYNMHVEQVGAKGNGIVNWKGSVNDGEGTFSLTRGNNFVAGHINTSTNTYSFEMYGDTGWIHESGALFTAELPPVTDDAPHTEASHLGEEGETVIVNGHTTLSALHTHKDDASVE